MIVSALEWGRGGGGGRNGETGEGRLITKEGSLTCKL